MTQFADTAYRALGRCYVISPTPFPDCRGGGETSADATTWTLALDYQLTPGALLYATSRRGYKQGGVNPGAPLQLKVFAPEEVTDFEIGLKSNLHLGGVRMRLNAAAYSIDYSDVQKVLPTIAGMSATINAAKASIEGIELESVIVPHEALEFSVSYAYTHGKFKRFLNPYNGQDLSDIPYPLIADHQVAATGRVRLPTGAHVGDLSFAATYTYQTSMSVNQAGLPEPGSIIDGYGLLNLTAEWDDIAGSALGVSAFLTNATDKEYVTSSFNTYRAVGYSFVYPGEPRMYGLRIKYRF